MNKNRLNHTQKPIPSIHEIAVNSDSIYESQALEPGASQSLEIVTFLDIVTFLLMTNFLCTELA